MADFPFAGDMTRIPLDATLDLGLAVETTSSNASVAGPSWRHSDQPLSSNQSHSQIDGDDEEPMVVFSGAAVKSQSRRLIRSILSESRLSAATLKAQRLEKERQSRLKRKRSATNVIDLIDDEKKPNCSSHGTTGDAEDEVPPDPCPSMPSASESAAGSKTEGHKPVDDKQTKVELKSLYTADGRMLVNVCHPPDEPNIYINDCLTKYLKPHQLEGVRFMYENVIESPDGFENGPGFGCILAHSMGLGKTLQVIAFVDIVFRYTTAKRVLILVPVNTLQNWLKEYNRWLPPIDADAIDQDDIGGRRFAVHFMGETLKTLAQRVAVLDLWFDNGGVLLMGYEMFRLLLRLVNEGSVRKRKTTVGSRAQRMMPFAGGPSGSQQQQHEVIDIEEMERDGLLIERVGVTLLSPGPDLVICDEGHRIKNLKSKTAELLNSVRTNRRVVLTGSPLQNNLIEYWCMVNFVRPHFLGNRKEFSNMFETPINNGHCFDSNATDRKISKYRTHVLTNLLKGFVQRRTHRLLTNILPKNVEYVLLCRKSPIQFRLYREFVRYCQLEIAQSENGVCNPLKAFAICCKIWNHPDILHKILMDGAKLSRVDIDLDGSLIPKERRRTTAIDDQLLMKGISYDWAKDLMVGYEPGVIENGFKLMIAFQIIKRSIMARDKVLLFSQSLYTLDLIESFLSQLSVDVDGKTVEWKRNKNYFRFDGGTNSSEREKLISRFNAEVGIWFFLISTRAGSLGINLTGANRVIIFDASWNPCHDAQAVCRVYRYGQTKRTYIYRLVTDNSMERAIFNRQIGKMGLSDRVVDEKQIEASVSKEELTSLLQYNEKLDRVENGAAWSTEELDTDDELLRSVCSDNRLALAQMPFLHKSLILESDETLSEREKHEAELWYQQELRLNEQRALPPPPMMAPSSVYPMMRLPLSGGAYGRNDHMYGGGHVPWQQYRPPTSFPMRATPIPMRLEMASNYRMIAARPPMADGGEDDTIVQRIRSPANCILPNISDPSRASGVEIGQPVTVIHKADGRVFVRLLSGETLDGRASVFDNNASQMAGERFTAPRVVNPMASPRRPKQKPELIDLIDSDSD